MLLKNENQTLPISKTVSYKIAMIGPHANATQDMLSNYHGTNTLVNSHSPLQAFGRRSSVSLQYAMGCDINCQSDSGFADAVKIAQNSDYAIVFLGLTPSYSFMLFFYFFIVFFFFQLKV